MDLNSPLLKAMPQEAKPKPGRLLRRVLILLLLIIAIAAPIVLITTRTAPETTVGPWLYWLHDHIYLPIKAYTFTLLYPLGLILWGPILLILILWLISYLSKTPIFKQLQIYLGRKAVRRKLLHPPLIKSARRFKKLGMKPELLEAVTTEQREKALLHLANLPLKQATREDRPIITRAARLTHLHTRLLTLPPSTPNNHLQAAINWLELYTRLRTRQTGTTTPEWLDHLVSQTAAQIDDIIIPLLQYTTPHKLETAKEKEARFDTQTLAVDLLYLASLKNDDLAARILGPNIPTSKREATIARRLAASTASRRAFLDRNRSRLENRAHLYYSDSLAADPEDLSLTGRLSLLIALDLAALANVPDVALGFIETIETLDFVLHLWQTGKPDDRTAQGPSGQQRMLWLIHGLPGPLDYRFCAELAEKETKRRKEIWQLSRRFSGEEKGPIRKEDFDLAESRVRALYHAAGPDFKN